MNDRLRPGVLGVGQMGAAIARRLIDCGWEVSVTDSVASATAAFEADATVCASPEALAAVADIVLVVVNDDAQVLEALTGPSGALAGADDRTHVLILSTIRHETLRAVADAATPHGTTVMDSPISGRMGIHSIPDLAVMVGGTEKAFEHVRPILDSFAGLVRHLGPTGAGLDAKLARNAIGYVFYLATLEGLRLTDACGIPRSTMFEILDHTGLEGTRGGLSGQADAGDTVPWPPEMADHYARMAMKDLRAAVERAADVGADIPTVVQSIPRMPSVFGAREDLGD